MPDPNPQGEPVTLGVVGGGQLARMWAQAAQRLGFATAVLDSDPNSPAGQICQHTVRTGYDDPAGWEELARLSQAITIEFENVPAQALSWLAQHRTVCPAAAAVAVAQDRFLEKAHLARCQAPSGVSVAPHARIEQAADMAALPARLLPGILKTARMGYDGKGQVRVSSATDLPQAWQQLLCQPCVLEQQLPLAAECSVIVARGFDGSCVHFPVQRNLHHDGILAATQVYSGNLPEQLADKAIAATRQIAEHLDYVGVLCVEFFVLAASSDLAGSLGPLVVNEIAPRPHNSGHYSLDACDVSQFELQVRTQAGLPLIQPRLHSPAIMLNLMGDLWISHDGHPPWAVVLALPGVHLHLYGKSQARPGRKMGHLTMTAQTPQQARETALKVAQLLGLRLSAQDLTPALD
jgi:5-(carboxyamino)imidazole ribonucleotide synthase